MESSVFLLNQKTEVLYVHTVSESSCSSGWIFLQQYMISFCETITKCADYGVKCGKWILFYKCIIGVTHDKAHIPL
jgi:hypothetical protein